MKATFQPRVLNIELTEEEATVLCALVGGVEWDFDSRAGAVVHDFYASLNALLPERTKSFKDFFKGDIGCVVEEADE